MYVKLAKLFQQFMQNTRQIKCGKNKARHFSAYTAERHLTANYLTSVLIDLLKVF